MRQELIRKMRERLLNDRSKELERIESINADGLGESMDDSLGELSTIDNHPADIGTEVFERSKDLTFKQDAKERIVAIDNALQAIEEGTYGICEVCGREILPERLNTLPFTTLCQNCKAENEPKQTIKQQRPIEEEFLHHPYERVSNTDKDRNYYDGEDTWQDVAKHSTSYQSDYDQHERGIDENEDFNEIVENLPTEKEGGVYYQKLSPLD